MIRHRRALFIILAACALYGAQGCSEKKGSGGMVSAAVVAPDSSETDSVVAVRVDSLPASDRDTRYSHLTEADFRLVAEELGVEVAAIKAVVEIEAGKAMKGFWAPGIPVANFDRTMYNRYKNKVKGSKASGETVPKGLSGYAHKEWTQLINARKVNDQAANMGTFWGMFQIGGFNYKLCGCKTVDEFVRLMSDSELEQLELFAALVKNTGMLKYLKAKDWAGFSARYNGPSYRKRGYHTRMAAAYKRHKAHKANE